MDETFLVISGDALCDVDLSDLLRFTRNAAPRSLSAQVGPEPARVRHRRDRRGGRIERFLEKPSWGQVFSDTINTGIYVLEPEVLEARPDRSAVRLLKELFPYLLEMGRPLYGLVMDGYWQDIGNLDQFRQANFDALEEQRPLNIPGIRIRGNVWLGEGVDIADLEQIEGPAFSATTAASLPARPSAPTRFLSNSVTLRERTRTTRSVIDASTHIGRSSLDRGRDHRPRATSARTCVSTRALRSATRSRSAPRA